MEEIKISKISEIVLEEINSLPYFYLKEEDESPDEKTVRTELTEHNNKLTRILSKQDWFLRCSWLTKVDILKRLAWRTTNLNTIILVLNTIYSARGKDWIYSANQGLNIYESDIILNDNNRTLDEHVLKGVIDDLVKWFETLTNYDQYSIIMDFIQLSDGSIIGKAFYEYLNIFKIRIREILTDKILDEFNNRPPSKLKIQKPKSKGSKESKKSKKDKNEKKGTDKIEKELEKQRQKELEELNMLRQKELNDIQIFLNEKFPDLSKDPYYIELQSLIQKWDTFILAYKKKLGIDQAPKIEKAKKGKDKGKGKTKKEKISKDLPDDIQLLPIWINKKLIASIDPKTFKNVKKTNTYWSFIAKSIKQDNKCRQSLNKNCSKLKTGLQICYFEKSVPPIQPAQKYCNTSNVTDETIRNSFDLDMQSSNTLISELCKACLKLNFSGTELISFPRYIQYIHDISLSDKNQNF